MSNFEFSSSSLKILGLTDYEAKSLVALMTIGVGTPRDVARESGIPYPSAYDSLRKLAQGGWVEFASTRPSIFRVREPSIMKEKVSKNINGIFESLQRQYNNIRQSPNLELIYTIVGQGNVRAKVIELLRSAEFEVIVVAPGKALHNGASSGEDVYADFRKVLQELSSRKDLELRLITDDIASLSNWLKGGDIRVRASVLAVDLLVDKQKALIGLPNLSACGWVDSPIIASHFGQFLELLWKDSLPLKPTKKARESSRARMIR
jgi:sugar-specific transcriptional regulator TrmB